MSTTKNMDKSGGCILTPDCRSPGGLPMCAGDLRFELDGHARAGIVARMNPKIYVLLALAGAITFTGCVSTKEAQNKGPMGLKDAYAGKFLIGTAGDLPGRYSEAELANIKLNYNVVTPENNMKPQPTHPSEKVYEFRAPDALVQ